MKVDTSIDSVGKINIFKNIKGLRVINMSKTGYSTIIIL